MSSETHAIEAAHLERFAAGRASAAERRQVLLHLFAGCAICQGALRSTWNGGEPPPSADDYDDGFARVEREVAAAVAAPCELAAVLLAQLDRHPPLRQETLVRNHPRFAFAGLVDVLLRRSWSRKGRDVEAALQDARLATLLAEREDLALERAAAGDTHCASAWTHYGNALRIKGDLAGADRALQHAAAYLQEAAEAAGYDVHGFFLEALGVLRRCQRDFKQAETLLASAVLLYQRSHDRSRTARALVSQAIGACYAGDPARGLELLRNCALLVDGEREPDLAFQLTQAGIRCFLDAGKPRQALTLWYMGRELYELLDDPLVRVKIGWLEGQILLALGELEPAILQLERTREAYGKRNMTFNGAVASLDLAEAYLRAGQLAPARSLVLETAPVFESLGVDRELLASLIMLTKLEQREGHLALLRAAVRQLERGV